MQTVTLFEHQQRTYTDLGWTADHPALAQIEHLNQETEGELLHLGYRYLKATQYVGVIRLDDVTIQILPKVDYDPSGDADARYRSRPHQTAVQSATKNLLHMLSYTQGFNIREQDVVAMLEQRDDWFEILTRLLATNLHRLLKQGMEHDYITVEESRGTIRGRWQLARQLKRRPHVRHAFDVAYDEFTPDTLLNRIFRFVVERLLLQTRNRRNQRLLRDIQTWLQRAQRLNVVRTAQLEQVHFTRLNERFRPAFNLARLFLENTVFQLQRGTQRTFAFVFDMNRLFEAFVTNFLQVHRTEILPSVWQDVHFRKQSRGETVYLAERVPAGKPHFRLQPDLLLISPRGRHRVIIDTKYKRLRPEQRGLGISRGDAYQMLAYAARFGCHRSLLLYPQGINTERTLVTLKTRVDEHHRDEKGNFLVAASLNLRHPLDQPEPLIQALHRILKEISHHGTQIKKRPPLRSL